MPITFYGWGTQGPERKNPGLTPGHRASLLGLSKTSSRSALGRFQVPDKLGDSMENADWPWPAFGPQQGQAASGVAELACRTEMGQVRAGWGRKPRPTPGGQPQALPPRPCPPGPSGVPGAQSQRDPGRAPFGARRALVSAAQTPPTSPLETAGVWGAP